MGSIECNDVYAAPCESVYADSKGTDQHTYLRTLISAFSVCFQNQWINTEWRAKARVIFCACAGWCDLCEGTYSLYKTIWLYWLLWSFLTVYQASILYKSTAGRYRPVRVADGPITARCRFIKYAYWVYLKVYFLMVRLRRNI